MKKTLLITGSLAILLLSACTEAEQSTQTETNDPTTSETTATLEIEGSDTTETPAETSTRSEADLAAYNGAIQLSDETFCDKIADEALKVECKVSVTDQKYQQEAIAALDETLCEKLSTDDTKAACKTNVEVATQQSQKLDDERAENKLYNEIVESGDFSKCDQLKDQWLLDLCREEEIVMNALNSGDITICKKLNTKDKQVACDEAYNDFQSKKETIQE